MNSTLHTVAGVPLYKLFLLTMLICPTVAIGASLIHPLRVWAAGGQWCQVLSPSGKFQVLYGYQCESTPVGLVRRFR